MMEEAYSFSSFCTTLVLSSVFQICYSTQGYLFQILSNALMFI